MIDDIARFLMTLTRQQLFQYIFRGLDLSPESEKEKEKNRHIWME